MNIKISKYLSYFSESKISTLFPSHHSSHSPVYCIQINKTIFFSNILLLSKIYRFPTFQFVKDVGINMSVSPRLQLQLGNRDIGIVELVLVPGQRQEILLVLDKGFLASLVLAFLIRLQLVSALPGKCISKFPQISNVSNYL